MEKIDRRTGNSEDDGCVEGALTRMGQLSDVRFLSVASRKFSSNSASGPFLGARRTQGVFVRPMALKVS